MAAYSWMRIGRDYFLGCREGYMAALAAMYRDNELVTDTDEHGDLRYEYLLPASRLRDRLDVLGVTIPAADRALGLTGQPADLVAFDDWLQKAAVLIQNGGSDPGEITGLQEPPSWVGTVDPRIVVRKLLEHCPDDTEVALDLSEAISREHVDPLPDLCARSANELAASFAPTLSLIVVAEGSTDSEFLSASLDLLYPHLAGMVTFLDYGYTIEGGTAALVKTLKSFASAKIANRVLGLFDNDTAGNEALLTPALATLASNFKTICLPHLPLGSSYPTLGPTGPSSMDVNGLAASLELFFGTDILTDTGGAFRPIQWTGYNHKLKRYQGEVTDKPKLQAAFRKRLKVAKARGGVDPNDDWSGIRLVLETILHAF